MGTKGSLGKFLAAERERLGKPVSLEDLLALADLADLAAGEGIGFDSDERSELLDRVAADPKAALRLKHLLRFQGDEVVESPDVEGVETRWWAFQERLDQVTSEPIVPRYLSRREPLRIWMEAAGLVMCAGLFFAIGRSPWLDSERPEPVLGMLANIETLTLSPLGAKSGSRSPLWGYLDASTEMVLLELDVSDLEIEPPATFEVLDADGRLIERKTGLLVNGQSAMTVSWITTERGNFEGRLTDTSGQTVATFLFGLKQDP